MGQDNSKSRDTLDAMEQFRSVCIKFREIANSTESKDGSLYGGSLYGSPAKQFRFLLRHPFKAYADFFRIAVTFPSNVNAIDGRFPTDAMLQYLEEFSSNELQRLKGITALNLRTHKDRLIGNPIFKVSIPIGALYFLIKLGSEWGPETKLSTTLSDYLKLILDSEFTAALFFGLVLGLGIMVLQIAFLIGPALARAQLLHDLVSLALEAKTTNGQETQVT